MLFASKHDTSIRVETNTIIFKCIAVINSKIPNWYGIRTALRFSCEKWGFGY